MTLATALSLGETALKLGLICSLTVLALFLSYSMLNVCDLSTDGCFTLGAAVGAAVAVSGHPFLSILAAMLAGICSGFVTGFLQTKMGVDSLLAGIIVNTGLYSIIGLCIANSFTALSGCLLSQSQKSVDINIGQGMVTIALASLLIGGTILGKGGIFVRAVGMVLGSFVFRLVYTVALRFNMPAFMLKLVSSVIVILAISGPYLKRQWPQLKRRMTHKKGGI